MNSEVTYCLLAEIRERKSNVASLVEIYEELVETLFAHYYPVGKISGQLTDLRDKYIRTFSIEIPYPTLKIILSNLKAKYGDKMDLFDDYSFRIDAETIESDLIDIKRSENDISELNKLYLKHCGSSEHFADLYSFIDQSKRELIAFVRDPVAFTPDGFEQRTVEFLNLIMGLSKYRTLFEKLLMGSIISSYFDVGLNLPSINKTLLLDTNFIVSLMDLHSEDSLVTTEAILKISSKSGYAIKVLPETIEETTNLLNRKAERIGRVSIFMSQKKHTIEYGCARRKMKRDELYIYASRVRQFLEGKGVEILSSEINANMNQGIEDTEIFKSLIKRPFNKEGVLHDAIAMRYIKENRNQNAKNISEVDAFFVTDTSGFLENKVTTSTRLPYVIRAEELLNILWLASPVFDSSIIVANIARMLTLHLDKKLPDKDMLRRIDEKIEKFSTLGLDLEACAELAINIAEIDSRQLNDLLKIDEHEQFKDKILELALTARMSKDESEKRKIKEYDELLVFLEEEKEMEKVEAMKAMEQGIQDLKSRFDDSSRVLERRHNEDMLMRDRDIIGNIDDSIIELKARCVRRERWIFSPFIATSIIGLIYLSAIKLIPNWSNVEPITYLISLSPIAISGIAYIATGRTIKWHKAFERIRKKIGGTLVKKIHNKLVEREVVAKRIAGLEMKLQDTIE